MPIIAITTVTPPRLLLASWLFANRDCRFIDISTTSSIPYDTIVQASIGRDRTRIPEKLAGGNQLFAIRRLEGLDSFEFGDPFFQEELAHAHSL
jgi:hypothetical protein